MSTMKRHNFHLPNELVAHLRAEAAQRDITMSEFIRRVLQGYLNEQKAKVSA